MKTTILAFLLIVGCSGKSRAQSFGVEFGTGYPFLNKGGSRQVDPIGFSYHFTLKRVLDVQEKKFFGFSLGYESLRASGSIEHGVLAATIPLDGRYQLLQLGCFIQRELSKRRILHVDLGTQLRLKRRENRWFWSYKVNPYLEVSYRWKIGNYKGSTYVGPSLRINSIPLTNWGIAMSPSISLAHYLFTP